MEWSSEEKKIESFREKFINSVVVSTEINEKTMLNWLETLDFHTFGVRTDGPPGGNKLQVRALIAHYEFLA